MNGKRAKELKKVAQHYYDKDKTGVPFKWFYKQFKKQYLRGEYNGKKV